MSDLARRELLPERASADVRAVVEEAGLHRAWARARYSVRLGDREVGQITSEVTGGQKEEQLAYVLKGSITEPRPVELRGFVIAAWDRKVERFVIETSVAGARHRLEGRTDHDGPSRQLFRVSYLPPGGVAGSANEWVLPVAPTVAPGPLPLPELDGGEGAQLSAGASAGTLVDPLTGQPAAWSLEAATEETVTLAGRTRVALLRELHFGAFSASLLAERSGFPLRIDLPASLSLVLVEDTRW